MDKKIIYIVLLVMVVVLFDFKIRPIIYRRSAVNTVEKIIDHWKNGNLASAMSYWKEEADSPPFYGVIGHRILNDTIGKKDGSYVSEISVILELAPDNPMPSGKNWVFNMKRTYHGWQIIDFHLAEEAPRQ